MNELSVNPLAGVAYGYGEGILSDVAYLGEDLDSSKGISQIEDDIKLISGDLADLDAIMTTQNGFTQEQVDSYTIGYRAELEKVLNPSKLMDAATYWSSHPFELGRTYNTLLQEDSAFNQDIGE